MKKKLRHKKRLSLFKRVWHFVSHHNALLITLGIGISAGIILFFVVSDDQSNPPVNIQSSVGIEELKIKEVEPQKYAFKTLDGDVIELGTERHSPPKPYLKLNKWDDEASLKVNIPFFVKEEPVLSNNKIRYFGSKKNIAIDFYPKQPEEIRKKINGETHTFKQNEEGGVEFDTILYEKPETNEIVFPIETKNLDFFYQPPLNQQNHGPEVVSSTETQCFDKDGKAIINRPENVVGSYAVYYKNGVSGDYSALGGKNYKTGKAFHIYRPKVFDANNNWVWGELNVDVANNKLTITVTQDFLDKAIYPVIVDPTFGWTGIGGSTCSTTSNYLEGSFFTSPSDAAWINSISTYSYGSGINLKGVVVLSSSKNIITNGVGSPVALGASPGWATSTLSSNPAISPSTEYILMQIGSASYTYYYDDGITNAQLYDGSNSYSSPTNPTDGDYDNWRHSIYATYNGLITNVSYQKGDGKGTTSETDDSTISSGSSNMGDDLYILVDSSTHYHSVIKFPNIFGDGANQIPLGSTINSATLTLEVFNPGNDVNVYQLIESWTETDVTWNSRTSSLSWTDAGADGTSSRYATAVGTIDCSSAGPKTVTVTATVQNWSDGEANEGWVLTDTGSDGVDFDSSECGTVANRPELTVDFTPPAGGGIAYVNGSQLHAGAASGGTIAAPAINAIAGNTIIACITNYTDPKRTVSSVTDTAGNTYTRCGNAEGADAYHDGEIWVATNITGNANNVVTATFSGSAENRGIAVVQYSGLDSTSPYDAASTGKLDASSVTTHTTNTATTNYADEVCVGWFITATTPYVLSANSPYTLRVAESTGLIGVADRIVSSTGTYSVTVSTASANQLYMMMRTFKAESAEEPDITTGLIAYWKLNESEAIHGTTIVDSSGQENDGTLSTGDGSTDKSVTGQIGQALSLDGIDDYISIPNLASTLGSTATMAFWIKTTFVSEGGTPGGNGWDWGALTANTGSDSSTDFYWGLIDYSGKIGIEIAAGYDPQELLSANPINDNQWHHIVITRNSSNGAAQVFVDGDLSNSGTLETGDYTSYAVTWFGHGHSSYGEYISGTLDEVRIYNRVLNQSDITELFNYTGAPYADQANFQFFESGDELPHYDAGTTPVIEAGDITSSGNDVASTPWTTVAYPAYVAGDLIIVNIVSDANVTHDWPATGPNGETVVDIVDSHSVSGSSAGPRVSAFYWIGTGTTSAGTLTVTPSASEQWSAKTVKVPAGEFDPNKPIDSFDVDGLDDTGTITTVPTPSWNCNRAGGRIVVFLGVDSDPVTAAPSGWSTVSTTDQGYVSATIGIRTAATSACENIASANYTIADDSSATIGYVINAPATADGRTPVDTAGTDVTLDVDTSYGWQFRLENTGELAGDDQYKIQYKHIEGTNTWTDVTDSSSVIRATLTGDFANGDDVPQYIEGSGTYVSNNNAALESTGALTLAADLAANNSFEGHLNFQIVSSDVSNNDTIQLRVVYGDGTPLEAYTDTPTITSSGGTAVSAPSFITSDTTSITTATTNHAITIPANQEGDLILVVISGTNASTNPAPDYTVPDGNWTEEFDENCSATSAVRAYAAWRLAPAGGLSTPQTFTSSAITGTQAIVLVYRGVHQTSPIYDSAIDADVSNLDHTSPNIAGVTASNTVVVRTAHTDDDDAAAMSYPTGSYNQRGILQNAAPTNGLSLGVIDAEQADPGDTGAVVWTSNEEGRASTIVIQPPEAAAATTTIGDGTSPANKNVAPSSSNNAVNAFTLVTNTEPETVQALEVTFTGSDVNDVAASGVKIYEDNGGTANEWDATDTLIDTASFSGTTASFTGLNISVDTSATQYLVTYDIAAGATVTNTLQGAITAATVTNTLVNNDTTDATLTVSTGDAMTTTAADGIWSGSQRYCHYANGYYWIVFYDGTNPVIFSSSDASTWNSQGNITADHTDEVEKGADIAVRFSGTTMIAVFTDGTSGGTNGSDGYNDIFYRKATLNNDGTVTWWPTSTDHEVVDGGGDDEFVYAGFDSENKPWIGGAESGEEYVSVREGSALESPSWTLRESTPVAATDGSNPPTAIFPVADTGDMYFIKTIYYSANKDLWGIGWDQSASGWGSWTLIVDADLYGADDAASRDAVGLRWSAVKTSNEEIHLVYIDSAGNINHRKGTDALSPVWSTISADITGETSHRKVTLAADGNNLYVFYDKNDNKIYYRKYNGSSWESEYTLKSDTTAIQGAISAYESTQNDEIGVVWVEGSASPYDVKFATINTVAGCGYSSWRQITIDNTEVIGTADLTDFPLLVSLSGDWLKTTTVDTTNGRIQNDSGFDIIFKDTGGTQLDHEIEDYDGTNGTLVAWVRIPTLSYNTDTVIYMYYGNPCISTSQENVSGVWDDNYVAVWHLSQTPDTDGGTDEILDSNNSNHGDSQNMDAGDQDSGRIDGSLDFDGGNDYVEIANESNFDFASGDVSISAWIYSKASQPAYAGIVSKYNPSAEGHSGWSFQYDDAEKAVFEWDDNGTYYYAGTNGNIPQDQWTHVVGEVEGTTIKFYVNGTLQDITDQLGGRVTNDHAVWIAQEGDDNACFQGIIDEVRISNTSRKADWIQTEFNNQKENSTFYSVGSEGAGCSYSHKRKITIQNSQVSGTSDLSNFPALVSLTDTALRHVDSGGHVTHSSGFDIIFRASDETTQLDHEIEEYDGTAGTVVAWVRIPTLSYNIDTVIYMYYGNSCISTSQENITGVWDSNYKGVWHLASTSTSGHELDSTSNNNHGLNAWDAEAEDFDDITDWTNNSWGTYTVEENPAGQLHLLAGDSGGTDSAAAISKANMAYEGDPSFAIEFRVRFDALANFTDRENGVTVLASNYRLGYDYLWGIEFFADRIHDYFNNTQIVSRTINTGQWYTYRFVVTDDDDVAIYEDGTYVTTANDIGGDFDYNVSYLALFVPNNSASPVTTEAHFDWVRASTETSGFGATRTDGRIDGSLDFEGTDDYVDAGSDASLIIYNSDFTWEAWAKIDDKSEDRDVVTKAGDGVVYAIELRYDFGEDYWEFSGNDGAWQYAKYTQANPLIGTWYHLVGVRDGSTIRIYVDGVEGAVTDTLGTLADSSALSLLIGRMVLAGDPRYWDGTIDEVRVSNIARSADWILTSYNNQNTPSSFYVDNGEESAGTVTLGNHTVGQESDNFDDQASLTGVELFAFKLTNTTDSTVTVKKVLFSLSAVTGILQGDFSNLYIYVDTDNDGTKDPGETTAVGGLGAANAGVTDITFSDDFNIAANTTVNYIMTGDVSDLLENDTVTIDLGTSNVTITAGHVGGSAPTSATHTSDAACDYSSWRQITIDNTKVSGTADLSNFPLLVSLSGDWLKTTTADTTNGRIENANGYDIIFKDTSGTQLDHEIEDYDGTNGTLIAWVRIATLSYDADTIIYMYYGNTCIGTSQENITGVWDANYVGVWHMKEDPSGVAPQMLDSASTNGNDGTSGGTMNSGDQVPGRINGSLAFDGSNDYIEVGTTGWSTSAGTFEAWINASELPPGDTFSDYIIGHTTQPSYANRIQLYLDEAETSLCLGLGDQHARHINIIYPSIDTWYHVVLTWDGTNYEVFVDAVSKASGTYTGLSSIHTIADIGNNGEPTARDESWNGIIDEVRVSDIPRTAAWIQTEYNNQNDPATFYGVGEEGAGCSYSHKRKITIQASEVSGSSDLTNFPALVNLTDDNLKHIDSGGHVTNSSGFDIVFRASDETTQLDHEIEKYDSSTGTIVAWVRIPTLDYDDDTVIYMYYGNTCISTSQENVNGVWDSNYKGVWHLSEDPSGTAPQMKDSTSNNNHGTSAGTMLTEDQIGGRVDGSLDFDGSDDCVDVGNLQSLAGSSELTMSVWFYANTLPSTSGDNYGIFMQHYDWDEQMGMRFDGDSEKLNGYVETGGDSAGVSIAYSGNIVNNTWYHVVLTFKNGVSELFLDGVSKGTDDQSGSFTTLPDLINNMFIASIDQRSGDYFDGIIDEVRISNFARSADWIKTSFNNQSAPSSFYVDDGEESAGTVTLSNHTAGQEPDNFGAESSYTGVELFAFKLTNTTDSDVTVKKVLFPLSAVTGILQGDFSNLYIYVDTDNDGTKDAGETTTVGGLGAANAGVTDITFSDNFTIAANTAVDYILVGDVSSLFENDTLTIDLNPENVTITAGHVTGTAPTSATHTADTQCIFSYRRPITIQASEVFGPPDLTDFPVLVSLSGTWLRRSTEDPANGHIKNEFGHDIIFRKADGKEQLDHEIESYDGSASGGTLVAWVRIPTLDHDDNTLIYMYYGNPCIDTSTQNVAGVWNTNFVGVWHLKEEQSGSTADDLYQDSTSKNNHGDDRTDGTAQNGKINGGQQFSGDGDADYVQVPHHSTLNLTGDMTISYWFYATEDSGNFNRIVDKGYSTSYYFGGGDGTNDITFYLSNTEVFDTADSTFTINAWHYAAVTYDSTTGDATLILDGNESGTGNYTGEITGNTDTVYISHSNATYDFAGYLDEVRISDTDRTVEWLKTEHSNQSDPATFYIVGDEEEPAPTAVDLISFTATGQDENVLVEWETAQEVDNVGFNLYRSTELGGTYSKLNRRLIPGLLSSVTGQQYTYIDRDVTRSVLYYYMLEDVDLAGTRTMHGPICVDWDGDGTPDDYIVDPDDDDTDTEEEDPEVSIPDTEFDELDPGLTDWTPSNISGSASWVKMASFKAYEQDDGVALEWETSYEVNNLGFHIYRELDGKFYRITPDLVPGSVFSVGEGSELPAGQSYSYWDALTKQTGREFYWLDSIELNGGRASFGPIESEISEKPIPKGREARFKSIAEYQVSKARAAKRVKALREELSAAPVREQKSRAIFYEVVPDNTPSEPRLPPSEEQWTLSGQPGVKIYVKEDGWYRVGEPELVAAGLRPGIDPRYLQLYADGVEQSIMVTGDEDGRFDPDDAVEFYGTAFDAPFTDAHVYWLVVGSRPGRRLDTPFTDIRIGPDKGMRLPRGLRGRRETLSFPYSVELKERTFYFAALKTGERENFFGSVISTDPVDQLLTLPNHAPSSPQAALLEVGLQGGTDVDHQVSILLNYRDRYDLDFSGQLRVRVQIPIPQGNLLEGGNVVTLTSQGGSMDISLVDHVRITYWHTYTADEDVLQFEANGGEWLSLGGFSTPGIRVVDITDPVRMLDVKGKVKSDGSNYAITFKVPMGGERTLLAFTEEKIKEPAGIAANIASSWHELGQGADVIIIGHKDLMESVRPLKDRREQQGMSVVLIDVDDLYDEFNFGAKSPWAVKVFLDRAYKYWNPQPRYLILVGDTSYDPRNYLGYGEFDLMPTKFMDTEKLKTASDDWFVDFDGDDLPEMAVGRLPAASAEEATTIVSKIINYEGYASLMNEVLIVSDRNDFHNFEQTSVKIAELIPGSFSVNKIFRGRSSTARTDLLDLLNQGQLLVNYFGHGSTKIWNGSLLTYADVWSLTNSPNLPFFVSTTCLNGFFQDPYSESLAEGLLKAPLGGAVAVWTSSGLTDPEEQEPLNKELITLLFNGEGLTIGEAVMRAKQEVADRDIRRTWILFGDPTLRLR